jgi:hypothetical protein
MTITEENKAQLIQCSAGLISNENIGLLISYKVDFNEFNELLDDVYSEGNHSLFEAVLWCMPNRLSSKELEQIYSKYILSTNHREHERIVRLFQLEFINDVSNIETLLIALNNIPDYLGTNDFKYPYIRKIIYAIGAQPAPNSIEALEEIANQTNDEQIRDLAVHQIAKRKELDR